MSASQAVPITDTAMNRSIVLRLKNKVSSPETLPDSTSNSSATSSLSSTSFSSGNKLSHTVTKSPIPVIRSPNSSHNGRRSLSMDMNDTTPIISTTETNEPPTATEFPSSSSSLSSTVVVESTDQTNNNNHNTTTNGIDNGDNGNKSKDYPAVTTPNNITKTNTSVSPRLGKSPLRFVRLPTSPSSSSSSSSTETMTITKDTVGSSETGNNTVMTSIIYSVLGDPIVPGSRKRTTYSSYRVAALHRKLMENTNNNNSCSNKESFTTSTGPTQEVLTKYRVYRVQDLEKPLPSSANILTPTTKVLTYGRLTSYSTVHLWKVPRRPFSPTRRPRLASVENLPTIMDTTTNVSDTNKTLLQDLNSLSILPPAALQTPPRKKILGSSPLSSSDNPTSSSSKNAIKKSTSDIKLPAKFVESILSKGKGSSNVSPPPVPNPSNSSSNPGGSKINFPITEGIDDEREPPSLDGIVCSRCL